MAYTIGGDGLLDFSGCGSEEEMKRQAWDYYYEHLNQPRIVAWDNKLVRGFNKWAFDHVVTSSTNKWDVTRGHDGGFSERRASCLPLIPRVVEGDLQSRSYRVLRRRGKRNVIRRVLSVIEIEHEYFIVVLEEDGDRYRFRTAFPSNKEYFQQCVRNDGTYCGIWGRK